MISETNTAAGTTSDPLYAEGLAHLQAGRWQDAIRCFEELARRRPDDANVSRLLDEARFKARLDAGKPVAARRWIIPWRGLLLRGGIVVAVLLLAVFGFQFLNRQVAPALAQARYDQQIATLLKQGSSYLEAEDYAAAESTYKALLKLAPNYPAAVDGVAKAKEGAAVFALYRTASAQFDTGDYSAALSTFTDLAVRKPGYRDVSQRIIEIKRLQQTDDLFAAAEADLVAGKYSDALGKYQEIQQISANYKRDFINGRLFDLYLQLGRQVIDHRPPALDQLPQALDMFTQAASIRPKDSQAAFEQQLAANYLGGQKAYAEKRWDDAVNQLRAAYDQRPDYLGGALIAPLYDSYIHSGDIYRDAKDYYRAWDQYRLAAGLPGVDTTMAKGRMASVQPYLTPTPTPSPTPTIDVTQIIASIPKPPTAIPSGTPAPPLSTFHNQIIFFADREDLPGLWVMNPNGSNRRYLGAAGRMQKEYNALRDQEAWSPDGRYRSYTLQGNGDNNAQIYIQGKDKDQFGNLPTWKITNLGKLAYDPVWSPDGAHVAFTGELGLGNGDDIFTIQPDGKNQWKRTVSNWEWNKHASWSPDSQRIVFWTNREGTKQIYVMDWEGHQQVNISKVAWDEYDPIWVK